MASSTFHTDACAALKRHYSAQDQIWISTQVIREFIAVLTNPKFAPKPLLVGEAVQASRYFHQRFIVAEESRAAFSWFWRTFLLRVSAP